MIAEIEIGHLLTLGGDFLEGKMFHFFTVSVMNSFMILRILKLFKNGTFYLQESPLQKLTNVQSQNEEAPQNNRVHSSHSQHVNSSQSHSSSLHGGHGQHGHNMNSNRQYTTTSSNYSGSTSVTTRYYGHHHSQHASHNNRHNHSNRSSTSGVGKTTNSSGKNYNATTSYQQNQHHNPNY